MGKEKTISIYTLFMGLTLAISCLGLSSCLSKSKPKSVERPPAKSTGTLGSENTKPERPESSMSLNSGGSHNCAILLNNELKCWGANGFGQLGIGDVKGSKDNIGDDADEMGDRLGAVDLGTGWVAKAVVMGESHTCVILNNDRVKCWGDNQQGQLGYGDNLGRGGLSTVRVADLEAVDLGTVDGTSNGTPLTVKAIDAGSKHTCAILSNNATKCWGGNSYGQLGQGHTNNLGDEANEMGNALLSIDLGLNLIAKAIAAGSQHTCAILNNDKVKCWGYNSYNQLGLASTTAFNVVIGDDASEMGGSLDSVDLGAGMMVKAIAAGDRHTCAILDNDKVKCWGEGASGQLGLGDNLGRGDSPQNLGDELLYVELGAADSANMKTSLTAKAIVAGAYHTCALLKNGAIKCWGANDNGQLGQGHTDNLGDEANEMGSSLFSIHLGTADGTNKGKSLTAKAISSGDDHVCAILSNNTVKCWGANGFGQLGIGDINSPKDSIGDGANEMGVHLAVTLLE